MSNEGLTNPNEIDALPDRAVVIDRDGDVWQYRRGLWCTYETAPVGSERLARKYGPVRILREAHPPTDAERATIIAELRWLAEAREKYQTDTFPSIAREVQTSRQLADILERKAPVAEGGAGFGWIPSWLWDEWDQMCQHASQPQGEPSDASRSSRSQSSGSSGASLVRPEGLVCGTCDKVIAPAGAGGAR